MKHYIFSLDLVHRSAGLPHKLQLLTAIAKLDAQILAILPTSTLIKV